MESLLDELALKTYLDLAQHSAHKSINLSKHHVFNNASEFCRVVAADRACVLHSLACMVRWDINTNDRVAANYAK